MIKLILAISVFLFLGSPFANAEQVYYCMDELTTGLEKNEKIDKWERMRFKESRFTIKFSEDYTKLDGLDEYGGWNCHRPYTNSSYTKNYIVCYHPDNAGNVFQFDKEFFRFLSMVTSVTSYLMNGNYGMPTDTASISGGTCQKF